LAKVDPDYPHTAAFCRAQLGLQLLLILVGHSCHVVVDRRLQNIKLAQVSQVSNSLHPLVFFASFAMCWVGFDLIAIDALGGHGTPQYWHTGRRYFALQKK